MQDLQNLHIFMNAFFMSFFAGKERKKGKKNFLADALKKRFYIKIFY